MGKNVFAFDHIWCVTGLHQAEKRFYGLNEFIDVSSIDTYLRSTYPRLSDTHTRT